MGCREDDIISNISKSFFSLEPFNDNLASLINVNKYFNQENLLSNTVHHPIIQKHPNKTDYNKKFLKQLITILESNGIEVIESIYKEYFSCLNNVLASDFYYRHYLIGDECIVIKTSYNLISEGTTGLCVWEGSLILSEWCLQNQEKLKNKIILELGCGVGVTGILTILNCNCQKYIFTDCNESVLNILKHNIKINIIENNDRSYFSEIVDNIGAVDLNIGHVNKPDRLCNTEYRERTFKLNTENCNSSNMKSNKHSNICQNRPTDFVPDTDQSDGFPHIFNNTTISVRNLSFEEISRLEPSDLICDFILASDIIYDCDLFPSLISALINIFNVNNNCCAIFVCKVRNESTFDSFMSFINQTDQLIFQKENINYGKLKLIHNQINICSQAKLFSIRGKPSR